MHFLKSLMTIGALICLLAFTPAVMAEEEPHRLTLFGGVTQDRSNTSETGATVGLAYSYRFDPLWSIGGLLDYAGGDIDAWIIGVPLKVFPWAGWFLLLAPGLEFGDSETSFMTRIGTGYDFELGHEWSLAPEFYVDLNRVEGTKWVYGLALSRGF